jgi:hypothetical protein
MIELHSVSCPYCGEPFDASVDTSAGTQEYIEDCYVCCRPIVFDLVVDEEGNFVSIDTRTEND